MVNAVRWIAYPISRPHTTQNLFSLYGLDDIAATVARKDPITGEKINKLRKSYEGKIKDFPGKNKAVAIPYELANYIHYPDEEWGIQKVMGKELQKGLSEDMISKLEKAVQAVPGKLSAEEHEKWRIAIEFDMDLPKAKGGDVPSTAKAATGKATKTTMATKSTITEPPRPKRRGTKRSYADDSFEGYGEGFVDDAGTTHSIMDDDGESRSSSGAKKKRRKVRFSDTVRRR